MVKQVYTLIDFEKVVKTNGLVVVDFFADCEYKIERFLDIWSYSHMDLLLGCGPCKKIAPVIEQFSNVYPEVRMTNCGNKLTHILCTNIRHDNLGHVR